MAYNRYPHSPSPSDDIYEASPQQTGVTHGSAYKSRQGDEPDFDTRSLLGKHLDDDDEKPPALPPRRSFSLTGQVPLDGTFHRSKERIMAYMIPLPQPLGPNGQPVAVPQRYMLYLPPAPDLLKPPPSSNIKERKRDKCVRKWQSEVRKAKTYTGTAASFSGLYNATVRGAVYCLSLIQRSELTFLSRLPRKTLQDLCFLHPAVEEMAGSRRFELVREEFRRNKHVAKRDFWIGALILPFAEGVDLAIPVGGGFTEVTLVWMIITGTAWKTASGMLRRLEFKDMGMNSRTLDGPENEYHDDTTNDQLEEDIGASAAHEKPKESRLSLRKTPKAKKPPVKTTFRPSYSLDELSHYIQAACHARNPHIFPDVGQPRTEAEVLESIGWAPQDRESEDKEGDVAWQIRKTTDDLKVVVAKAAKTWENFCETYVIDPEKALRDEEKARVKNLQRKEKERIKRLRATD